VRAAGGDEGCPGTFEVETDDEKLTFKLSKARWRSEEGAEAATKYQFAVE